MLCVRSRSRSRDRRRERSRSRDRWGGRRGGKRRQEAGASLRRPRWELDKLAPFKKKFYTPQAGVLARYSLHHHLALATRREAPCVRLPPQSRLGGPDGRERESSALLLLPPIVSPPSSLHPRKNQLTRRRHLFPSGPLTPSAWASSNRIALSPLILVPFSLLGRKSYEFPEV